MRARGVLLAAGLLGAACSSSSGSATAPQDAGVDAHDAAVVESAAPDVGASDGTTPPDAGAGDADGGLACSVPVTVSTSAACDTCVADYCDPAWCTCAQDTANVDDAGANGCERYVACVSECVQTDAGLPTTCTQTLCAHAPYTSEEQQEGRALLNCIVLHCSTDCPQ